MKNITVTLTKAQVNAIRSLALRGLADFEDCRPSEFGWTNSQLSAGARAIDKLGDELSRATGRLLPARDA